MTSLCPRNNAVAFSVIISCRNPGTKLGITLTSVLTHPESLVECIIIDGASSDGTAEWLGQQRAANLQWISEEDAGVYDAMNKGIRLATGRFLLFLGAGDILLPGSLEKVAEYIERMPSPGVQLIYGDVVDMQTRLPFTAGPYTKTRICRENVCHQGIFYERGIFEMLGGYELQYPIMADWAFNLKCFGESRVAKLHFPGFVAEFEGGGLCSHTPDLAFARDRLNLIETRIGRLYALRFRIGEAVKRRLNTKA